MVRSDLKRDMASIPEISGPQEREKWGTPRGNVFTMVGGPQSLVGNQFPGTRASCDLVLSFRENERDHSSASKEDSLRERERGP
jgi:hypothetical protein